MPPFSDAPREIAVIGAGIIGACIAVELTLAGHQVTLIDPESPGSTAQASYGNGAFISPASILPMSYPGMWRHIPGYLLDPTGPVTIRPQALPQLMGWLCRFLWAGATETRYRKTVAQLNALLHDAPAQHQAIAAKAGLSSLIVQSGLLYAFDDRAAQTREALGWQLRRDHGVALRQLSGPEMRELNPDLSPHYGFGLLVEEGAHCTDPGGYVAELVAFACAKGARLLPARVIAIEQSQGRVTGLRTSAGVIPCDDVVVAAGHAASGLARQLGERIPLAAERGYHVEIAQSPVGPMTPVMPQDGKMANTMTLGGLRAAGQVELTMPNSPPDWRRADILLGHLKRSYPTLDPKPDNIKKWYGHRPSTPDGVPVIGRARFVKGAYFAFGHGHSGLAAAPRSAQLIRDLIAGQDLPSHFAALSSARFR